MSEKVEEKLNKNSCKNITVQNHTLRIVSQFFHESLQNEAEIQPRNSNIWASNYTSHLVFPRVLASDSQNPTFLGLLYLSYLQWKTRSLSPKSPKFSEISTNRRFLKIRNFWKSWKSKISENLKKYLKKKNQIKKEICKFYLDMEFLLWRKFPNTKHQKTRHRKVMYICHNSKPRELSIWWESRTKRRKEMNVLSCRTLPHLFPFLLL